MRDLLGNPISENSLLWWISKQIPLRVARIEESRIVTMSKKHDEPETVKLILEISVPLQKMTNGAETQLADFICAQNPNAERLIEEMLEGRPKQ